MNPLAALRSRGITLFLDGQSLKFKSVRGITPAEKESIRRNREEIIRLIRQEEAIPTATSEQQDLFRSLIVQIETGRFPSSLWPKVFRYLKRRLPAHLFTALRQLIEDQGDDPPRRTKEWLSPYPARCFDCSRREGCKRTERGQWGLLNHHSCQEYRGVKP